MMIFLLMFFTVSTFAQGHDNIKPYVSSDFIGLQANPILTGVKSSVKNQETEFNITLFYHDKYDLKDDEILGMVEGRLISEKSISSFDLIKQLQKDEQDILFNIESQQQDYREYLKKFRMYKRAVHRTTNIYHAIVSDARGRTSVTHAMATNTRAVRNTNIIHIVSIDKRGVTNVTHAIINDKGKTNTILVTDSDNIIHIVEIDDNGVTNVIHTIDEPSVDKLSYINQKFVAQSITNVKSLLSDEELEQLIYIERLKEEYNKLLELYNAMTQQASVENTTFDPADPSERFTIAVMGEDNISTMWSKSFSLDGVDNYQSYDKSVWFLGYKLLITKKDVRALYNIFTQNKRVKYIVTGVNGTIDFDLSSYFIDAIKEIMDLYAHGKLKIESGISFPLLRE